MVRWRINNLDTRNSQATSKCQILILAVRVPRRCFRRIFGKYKWWLLFYFKCMLLFAYFDKVFLFIIFPPLIMLLVILSPVSVRLGQWSSAAIVWPEHRLLYWMSLSSLPGKMLFQPEHVPISCYENWPLKAHGCLFSEKFPQLHWRGCVWQSPLLSTYPLAKPTDNPPGLRYRGCFPFHKEEPTLGNPHSGIFHRDGLELVCSYLLFSLSCPFFLLPFIQTALSL